MAVEPGRLDRRQRRRDAVHRRVDQGDPQHPHVRGGRRWHVRQHPDVALRRSLRSAHRQQGRSAARDGGDRRRQALRERRYRGQRRTAAVPGSRRHPLRLRDRRVLSVDEQQLQQAGPSGRRHRQRRGVALGGSPRDL